MAAVDGHAARAGGNHEETRIDTNTEMDRCPCGRTDQSLRSEITREFCATFNFIRVFSCPFVVHLRPV
jgi:hypothetical protein